MDEKARTRDPSVVNFDFCEHGRNNVRSAQITLAFVARAAGSTYEDGAFSRWVAWQHPGSSDLQSE